MKIKFMIKLYLKSKSYDLLGILFVILAVVVSPQPSSFLFFGTGLYFFIMQELKEIRLMLKVLVPEDIKSIIKALEERNSNVKDNT